MLENLIDEKDAYISGEKISKRLNISRAAVWKHIKNLKEEGYEIESFGNKGYKMKNIEKKLETAFFMADNNKIIGKHYKYLKTVDSTNDYAKKMAKDGKDGLVVLSECQTGGKGRRGRTWQSLPNKGIYMSLLLKPEIDITQAPVITHIMAMAVYKTIMEELNIEVQIKWPNDIVYEGKKICGISAELSGELEELHYVIVGIGVNLNQEKEDFYEEIAQKATSLKLIIGKEINRVSFLATLLENIEFYYQIFTKDKSLKSIYHQYKDISATIGKTIKVIYNSETLVGQAVDINEKGELVIINEQKEEVIIRAGEVSIRGEHGYV